MTSTLAPVGLRDRKKDQTRRLVQATALRLFTRDGFDHVTVDEIAAACDVSRATVFRYFPTKEDLVVGTEPERLLQLREAFEQRPADEAVFESVRHALVALSTRCEDDREQMLASRAIGAEHASVVTRGLAYEAEWTETFAGLLAERAGSPVPDLKARVLAGAVMAAVRVAVAEWLDTDGRADLPSLISAVVDLLAEGFEPHATPKPRRGR